MAREKYSVKGDDSPIYLTVNFAPTGGLENTTVIRIKGDTATELAQSTGNVGSIPKTSVGIDNLIAPCTLQITSSVIMNDLFTGDPDNVFANLNIAYKVEGGKQSESYQCEDDDKKMDKTKTTITVEKSIRITKN